MKIGVLALQGDVREHRAALTGAGATPVEVKHAEQLDDIAGIVIPGGESTTIGKLLDRFGLLEPLRARLDDGLPAYGTCAGLILMAKDVTGPDPAPHRLDAMDVTVRRNAYGRQVDSFEADVDVAGLDPAFRAVFIRAPRIEDVGDGVDVLASYDGDPVLVRQGHLLGSTFHPEISGDPRVHELFVDVVSRL